MKFMAASITDSAQVIMSRLFIRHMLYKGQISKQSRCSYSSLSLAISLCN